ncbi:hypothetical protein PG996_002757 [Apiospora saccharicola]|uniref:Uncharacterized protein n=1 Tax=Apiospora saccharicola TaxID=335842 RepID=A0ABR1WNE1_9PEZI
MTTPAKYVVDDPPVEDQNAIPPLASYEDLRADYWYPNMPREVRRLRWSLDGPLDKAVSVMHHAYYDPDDPPPEPFYQPQADNDDTTAPEPGMQYPICLYLSRRCPR